MAKINPKNAAKEMTQAFKTKFQEPAMDKLKDGVQEHINVLYNESQALVPMDTGALAESANREFKISKNMVEGGLGYGGNNPVTPTQNAPGGLVFYAVKVHEDQTLNHPRGGQANYLGEPIATNRADELKTITKYLKQYIK